MYCEFTWLNVFWIALVSCFVGVSMGIHYTEEEFKGR